MNKKSVYETPAQAASSLVPMSVREVVMTIIWGALIGAVVVGVYLLMNHFVFTAVLCRPQSPAECSQAPTYAIIVSQIVGVIAGLGILVRLRVYRPLLIVLATVISLWSLHHFLSPLAWFGALLVGALLFGLSYGLFTWIARIRSFLLALVITIVMVVIVRIAFM